MDEGRGRMGWHEVKRDLGGHTHTPEPTPTRPAPWRVSAGSSVGVGSRFRTVAGLSNRPLNFVPFRSAREARS